MFDHDLSMANRTHSTFCDFRRSNRDVLETGDYKMNHVQKVETNIKGHRAATELGQYTLLVGPNESGKSRIAEAIQLALSGSAWGLLWRAKTVKSGSQLDALRPGEEAGVFAEATFTDGGVARWSMQEGSRPNRAGANGVCLPVAELHHVLAGSPDGIRTFFYEWLVGESKREELDGRINHRYREAIDQLLGISADTVNLPALIIKAAELKREHSANAKGSTAFLGTFSGIAYISNDALNSLWVELEQSKRFGKLKNLYRDARESDDQRQLAHITTMLKELGTQEELRIMRLPSEVQEEIETVISNRALYDMARAAKNNATASEGEAKHYAAVEKDLKRVLAELMEEPLSSYEVAVNEFMAGNDLFKINAVTGSIAFGLVRPDGFHTALSGSTEARVIAAMGAALADQSETPGVIVMDDRMWDTDMLGKTMAAMENCPCQVIIMSTIRPKGRPRSKWTYVEVG
jgi:energy-coupling factor transporter ATP-binding protein EcfA2